MELKDLILKTSLNNKNENLKKSQKYYTNDYVYLSSYYDTKLEEYIPFASDYAFENGKLDYRIYEHNYLGNFPYGGGHCSGFINTFTKEDPYHKFTGYRTGVPQILRDAYNKETIITLVNSAYEGWGDLESYSHMAIARPNTLYYSYCPVLRLDKKMLKNLNLYEALLSNSKVLVNFGEYPQKEIKFDKDFNITKLQQTGKYYFGYLKQNGEFAKNYEYEFADKKYVKVVDRYDETHWFEVEPINWRVINNTEDYIELKSLSALLAGIPFNLKQDTLWQNSLIRAYLNGYNIKDELKNGNGNEKFMSEINYDYSNHNFLNEAFDYNIKRLFKENKELIVPESNYKKYSYNKIKTFFSYLSYQVGEEYAGQSAEEEYEDITKNSFKNKKCRIDFEKFLNQKKLNEDKTYELIKYCKENKQFDEIDFDKKACENACKKILSKEKETENIEDHFELTR